MLKKLPIVLLPLFIIGPVWSRASPQVSLGLGAGSARGLYDQIVQKINQVRKSYGKATSLSLGPFSGKESATARRSIPDSAPTTTGAVPTNSCFSISGKSEKS